MKRIIIAIVLGFVALATFDSCSKTASEMIVGRWESWRSPEYLEFDADGKMSVWRYGMVYEGSYQVEGPNIVLDFDGRTISGIICEMYSDRMGLEIDGNWMGYYRQEEPFPVCTWKNTGPTISVTGDTWFVLDHQYNSGEEIHMENVTFGLYNAIDWNRGGFQTLLGCCKEDGKGVIFIQNVELPNSFGVVSKVSYKTNSYSSLERGFFSYEYSTSNGYILYNTDVVISDYEIYLNEHLFTDYHYFEFISAHALMNVNDCLFASDESGSNVVQNQTASCGTITFTKDGIVTAKYIPTLDDNGIPCFYNSVSGRYIHHSGSGTPIFKNG